MSLYGVHLPELLTNTGKDIQLKPKLFQIARKKS